MSRFALVNGVGEIINVIDLENGTDWRPPSNHSIVQDDHEVANIGGAWDGSAFQPPPQPPLPPLTKEELAPRAAAERYDKETGGVTWGQFVIQTDRDSQTKLIAEFVAITAGIRNDPAPWKFAEGKFSMLSNAEMSGVILTARTHIADAFATERTVLEQIANGTITTVDQITTAFAA